MTTTPTTGNSGNKKKENIKSDFMKCNKCSIIILPKDREKHLHTVVDGDGCQTDLSAKELGFDNTNYDFIRNGTLFVTVRELQNKDNLLGELSMSLQRQILLVSPFTLKMANIAVNDYVIVTNARGHASLRIVWPHMAAPLLSAYPLLQCDEFSPASRLSISRFDGNILEASTLEVEQVAGIEISEEIQSLVLDRLRRTHDATVVHLGEEIRCNHYCESYTLRIVAAESKDLRLETSMAALSIRSPDKDIKAMDTYYRITHNTEFSIRRKQVSVEDTDPSQAQNKNKITFEDIGGLQSAKASLKAFASITTSGLKQLARIGVRPPRRILIIGPSGTGKSMLASAFASQISINIFEVTVQDLIGSEESPGAAAALLKKARHKLILLDNVECFLGGKRDARDGYARINAFIRVLPPQSFVIATSGRVSTLDEAVRGLFDAEIETAVPKVEERLEILKLMLRKFSHHLKSSEIDEINSTLHGYTGANLESLIRHAVVSRMTEKGENQAGFLENEDLKKASKIVTATPMREVVLDIPKVYWSDIGGMEKVKQRLRKSVEWPLLHKDDFRRMGIKPPSGLLMYGPPGCAKTMIAQALATESGLNFLAVKGPELFSKWVGDSERAVRDLFRKARAAAPSIVFFDEIDAIGSERKRSSGGGSVVGDRVLTQLLTEIDGIEALEGVMIVAATNRPDIIDEALLRPGRLDSVVYVPLPDLAARREILQICFKKHPVDSKVQLEDVVNWTSGYSGAEIVALMQEAAIEAYEEHMTMQNVSTWHIEKALTIVTPRITNESVAFYERFHKTFSKK
ncbi:spermatogenesis-associated protein 5-like [Varroa jacobsoni]|uniref:spermatogenesis-associated protein 5-like n=1 Tax=Varroa jacobsoni TaxID=62625 RepID=UPI000BFA47C3|nr:spermatogenesis-associated protein 5-like [Varroa jacobsoni]XP_022691342.1 spermatogenesis-associated protein 5-like [Varroa jacobsoni]XP_022691343.1 spermatogenesis-associated protein 5-like [Varroa jacobsoni]XP_022691344.1 spermatogenesis-associated protein 5-like [Varroa jacobsoni]